MLVVRCVISSSSSSASTTASSSPCMLTTGQSLLVVISTAAFAIKFTGSAPYSPESNGLAETSIRFSLLAFVAFSITLAWIRSFGEKLPTTPYTYSTSRRQDLLAKSLRMKLHMALCLMSASFACLAVSPLQRSHIPRRLTTRQCALPTWVTLVTESIVSCSAGTRLQDIRRDRCEI
jgi:hypothetical protein